MPRAFSVQVDNVSGDKHYALDGIQQDLQFIRSSQQDLENKKSRVVSRELSGQICLGCSGKEPNILPLQREIFEYLGHSVAGIDHNSTLRLCCVKSLKIRQADLAICENNLCEFSISKGTIEILDLPSFVNCIKMRSFRLRQDAGLSSDGKWPQKFIKFIHGMPIMPSTVTEFEIDGVEDSEESPINLDIALHRTAALDTFRMSRMVLRNPLQFVSGFHSMETLVISECEGVNPSNDFWKNSVSLKTIKIIGNPTVRKEDTPPLFGYPSNLPSVSFSHRLQEMEFVKCNIPEIPSCISNCHLLESIIVTSCGLTTLPKEIVSLPNLENLSVCQNNLYLEGISVLAHCAYFLLPPPSTSKRSSRVISLAKNPLPAGTPLSIDIVPHLIALLPTVAPASDLRVFNYTTLEAATNGFTPSTLLSDEGAFGPVFKGRLGATYGIAVKLMREETVRNIEQFEAELCTLQKCRHPNLVQLIGCSHDGPSRCIVYEFKSNGTVRGILNNLQSENARKILWRRRICWLYQVASALEYLHCLVTPPIIHRDIKTMNILLDESLNASIGDFGIARVCPEIITHSRASTRIFGTPGYIDPEYAQTGQLKVSCDIYSFGVVILELLNSRPAFDPSNNPPVLRDAFDEACEDREVNAFLDTRAGWPPAGNALSPTQKIVDMAVSCLKSRSSRRPKTEELAASLHSICTSDFCFAHQLNLSSSSTGEKGPAEEMECVICLSLPASHALIPCGHKCLCEDHATMTMALDPPLCPVCRAHCDTAVQIFS